jgi:hypothetical protein
MYSDPQLGQACGHYKIIHIFFAIERSLNGTKNARSWRDAAVQGWHGERVREIRRQVVDHHRREAGAHDLLLALQLAAIFIHGIDFPLRANALGKRQRECAAAGPEVRPHSARLWNAAAQQVYVVLMIHVAQSYHAPGHPVIYPDHRRAKEKTRIVQKQCFPISN